MPISIDRYQQGYYRVCIEGTLRFAEDIQITSFVPMLTNTLIDRERQHPKDKASCTLERIGEMVEQGMSVLRINMAHSSHAFAKQVIADLRSYTASSTSEVAVCLDINGPKVRTGKLVDGVSVHLRIGDEMLICNKEIIGDATRFSTTYLKELVNVGEKIYVDDGYLSFTVLERTEDGVRCRIDNSGVLGENKGINFPSHVIKDLPALSKKDLDDIHFAIENDVDYVCMSCIRSVDDVQDVRLLLGNSPCRLIAKIENKNGLSNYESILRVADGIVIDRGYLGADVDVEIVATAQKRMITMANAAGKPILVANQVLESMVQHPRPTRSEAADIANAVMDGTDGLVLSSETASGEYVLESIATMRKIAYQAELQTDYLERSLRQIKNVPKPLVISESIASSTVLCARQVNAAVIICLTENGGTARLVAKYRPLAPVVAVTMNRKTAQQLSMCFGIIPFYHVSLPEDMIRETMRFAIEVGACKPGQVAVITCGQLIGFVEGTTTRMQVMTIPADL